MRLTIVIPAYNEEHRIGPTLESYLAYFGRWLPGQHELLVVLNGCRDGTLAAVERCVAEHPRWFRYLVFPQALGKGGAILEGFRQARGDLIAYTDADGIVPPQELAKVVAALDEGAAGAIGVRSQAAPQDSLPVSRRLASLMFRWLARLLLGLRARDPQCPAKVLCREAVETLLPYLSVAGWAVDVDLLAGCAVLGLPLREVEVQWVHQQGSRLRLWRAVPEMVRSLLWVRRKWARVQRGRSTVALPFRPPSKLP